MLMGALVNRAVNKNTPADRSFQVLEADGVGIKIDSGLVPNIQQISYEPSIRPFSGNES